MKNKYLYPFLLVVSCAQVKQTELEPAPLYQQPKYVKLNLEKGYNLNQFTGDTLSPIINAEGDTIKTGVHYFGRGKVIPLIEKADVVIIDTNKLIQHKAQFYSRKEQKVTEVVKINKEVLEVVPIKKWDKDDTANYLINSYGKKVKTGIPIKIKPKTVVANYPQPSKSLPPVFKDAARSDIQCLDVEQGLPSSYILYSYQDKNGFLWMGTYGGGVVRYDGSHFTVFTKKEGLTSNVITSIIEDREGNFWFGTHDGGLNKYDGHTFRHYTEREGFINNEIKAITEDKKGRLWIGTESGCVKYDGESFTNYTQKEGLNSHSIEAIEEDSIGNLWFGTAVGIVFFNNKDLVCYTEKEGLVSDGVHSITRDKKGNLWLGSNRGVIKYDGESFTTFIGKESEDKVYGGMEDKNGDLWFSTDKSGVMKYDGSYFSYFTENEGLGSNSMGYVIEDREGNLWLGTTGGGIIRYNDKGFKCYTKKSGLINDRVLAITEDSIGNLWFGTNGGGGVKFDGKYFTHYTQKEGLYIDVVTSVLEDKKGDVWLGTYRGAVKYSGNRVERFTKENGFFDDRVLVVEEDRLGNLWFGTIDGGVVKYDGTQFVQYSKASGLSSDIITSIIEDQRGNIWMGTNGGGIIKYNGETFINYTEKEGLNSNVVWCIMEDKEGEIWIGTEEGIIKFENNMFICFSEKEGLSNNIVWSLVEDQKGHVWAGTEMGLNELVIQRDSILNKESIKIYNYLKRDGLRGVDFFWGSAYIDNRNRAWWGSGKGLITLDLNTHKQDDYPPVVYLSQVDVNGQFIDYQNLQDSLDIQISSIQNKTNIPINLKLPYDKNHMTFHFAAIELKASHKIKYSYRLKGLNDNWSHPTTEMSVDYKNLTYGRYVFELKAVGENQKWCRGIQFSFYIKRPWWHTWYARLGYIVVGVLLIIGLEKIRMSRLRKRKNELEYEVEMATEKLRSQKAKIERVHIEITDSISYAERIQRSFLATQEILKENLKDYFIYFQPKNVVSGDFYWARTMKDNRFAILNADSTGHGVPGAIMSIFNIASIEKAVDKGLVNPAEIFNESRRTIIHRLNQSIDSLYGHDGMDASLMIFNSDQTIMHYAAAQNPIWIVREGKLIEIKAEKMPVGKHYNDDIPFVGGVFELESGDVIYTSTDGFKDQFGGKRGKKFKVNQLKDLILINAHLPMQEQKKVYVKAFQKWKGDLEQVDDICLIGVRV